MSAKCPKCEGTEFSIEKSEDKYCYVICCNCESIIGVLEDIDFNQHYNKVIKNHVFFENRINTLESELNKLKEQNKKILDMVEIVNANAYQILNKVK